MKKTILIVGSLIAIFLLGGCLENGSFFIGEKSWRDGELVRCAYLNDTLVNCQPIDHTATVSVSNFEYALKEGWGESSFSDGYGSIGGKRFYIFPDESFDNFCSCDFKDIREAFE